MKKSRVQSKSKERSGSGSASKELPAFRSMSTEKSMVGRVSATRLHSTTPDKEQNKESPVRMLAMETIMERRPKKKKKEKRKKEHYEVNLKEIKPINLEKEKQTFFSFDGQYSPFFIYANFSQITEHDKEYKGMEKPHDKYLALAVRILERATQLNYLDRLCSSPLLNVQETSKAFDDYIDYLEIGDLIDYEFVENTVAPTSVIHNNIENMSKVIVGLPIQYRKVTVQGVLNHEIGTHFIRKYNNRLQKWHKDRKKFALQPYLKHEEGLAAINQLFSIASSEQIIPPMLFQPALHYYSCYQASRMSFASLFQDLTKYHKDPEMRWRECVRVKRGIADTGAAQGMYKDQIYLRGAVRILKYRKQLNFMDFHCGKMTVKDCLRLSEKKSFAYDKTKRPHFLNNMEEYNRALDRIAKENFIDDWLQEHGKA